MKVIFEGGKFLTKRLIKKVFEKAVEMPEKKVHNLMVGLKFV